MKILHVSLGRPPFYTGGLTRYCEDLMLEQVNRGHNVGLIYPGNSSFNTETRINTKKEGNVLFISEIINPLPIAMLSGVGDPKRYCIKCNSDCYDRFLDETRPEIIHVHSFMGIHKEFFESAKKRNIRLIFTTHDYYPFCLRCSLLDTSGKLCYEHSSEKCMNCNKGMGLPPAWERMVRSKIYKYLKYTNTFKRIRLMGRKHIKSVENIIRHEDNSNEKTLGLKDHYNKFHTELKVRENITVYEQLLTYYENILKLMDLIHCNSELSCSIYKRYFPEMKYKIISITHKDIPNRKTVKKCLGSSFHIGYLNGMIAHKGVEILLAAFEKLKDTDIIKWELELWGDDYSSIADGDKIHNHGKYRIEEMDIVFSSMDLLIVPSLCWETFGFVVLEALSYGIPVVSSDRVGACMLLEGSPVKVIYRAVDAKELALVIENISQKEMYKVLIEHINKMKINNGMDVHANEMMKLYFEEPI